jgi:23S rRNA pseudouridine1911/1915/1917 synthase
VHRLDKDTTGVLIAAKTAWMHQRLAALFQTRQMRKEYLAVCIGNPGDGEIEAAIGRHPVHRKQMMVTEEGGRHARTLYHTVATSGELSVVRIQLVTGRTHQARVHLRHIGHPILGDPVYGDTGMNTKHRVQRQMLHAALLAFIHPMTQESLVFEAPVPDEMQQLIQKISPCV